MRQDTASHTGTLLPLIEQLIMVLVFALSAAMCLQAFAKAQTLSGEAARRDRALLEAQTAIETVKARGDVRAAGKALGGRPEDGAFHLEYASDWSRSDDPSARYLLTVCETENDIAGLRTAQVWVCDLTADDGGELLRIPFAWQEVTGRD